MLTEAVLLEQNKRLREENDELRETIRQIQVEKRAQIAVPPGLPRMTVTEERAFLALWSRRGRIVPKETIYRDLYRDDEQGKTTSRYVKKWFSKASVYGRPRLSAELRNAVFDRDGARCRYCGSTEGPFHVDHVVAVARGGADDLGNLVIACASCNCSKGARSLEEWKP